MDCTLNFWIGLNVKMRKKKIGKTGECGCSLPKFNDSNKLVDAFLANEVKNAAGKSEDIYMRKMPTSLLLQKGGQAISK